MLRQLVDRETKRVRDLPTGENKGDLRMSEKAIWLAELNNMRTELTRYEGYKEVVTNE
jgi:ribosomal protein L19E